MRFNFLSPSAYFLLALVLLVANALTVALVIAPEKPARLAVSFLDVGQGDSILIEGPTGIQVLVDGGKDRSVLRELPRVMHPLDRSIDAVVATHPDADHIGGLPDVLARYRVSTLVASGREGDSSEYERIEDASAREPNAVRVLAREGMRIHLGGGAYADILHPEDNVAKLKGTNDASVAMRLVYGETEFMLTGDAPSWVEDRLVEAYGSRLRSDVLKAGHHGSKTSTSAVFLDAVDPSIVVVSAGKDNSYGHPHGEVVDRVLASNAALRSTADAGTITFVSDGITVAEKKKSLTSFMKSR